MNFKKNVNYSKNNGPICNAGCSPKGIFQFHSLYSRLLSTPQELVQDINEFFNLPSVPKRQHSKGKHRYLKTVGGLNVELVEKGFGQYKRHFREYMSSPTKKPEPKNFQVDSKIESAAYESDTRAWWPIFVLGYSCVFVFNVFITIIREALQGRFLPLNRSFSETLSELRNLLFSSFSSTWMHCVNGNYVQHRDGKWYKCFMTNGFDYLALPHELPRNFTKRVDRGAISDFEERVAQYVGAESGILFVTGFLANVETLQVLGKVENTVFLWDSECHRSALEGVRSSPNFTFEHNSMRALEELLQQHKYDYDHFWVCVEGMYSMSGDAPDYQELKRLKDKYGFKLMVDRAHSFVFDYPSSSHGGSSDLDAELNLLTFAKSGGHYGGFVFGKKQYVELVRNHASEESKAYPLTSLNMLENVMGAFEDGTVAVRTEKVKELSNCAYDCLMASNWKVLSPRGSHIVIVETGICGQLTCALQQWCIQHGVYFAVIGHPAIPSRFKLGFRICINASMTNGQLYQMVQTMNCFDPFAKNLSFAVAPTRDMGTALVQVGGMKAARNLGGTSLETKETEAAVAQKFGYDRCIYCADTTLGLKYWSKLFSKYGNVPVYFAKNGLDEVVTAREQGHAVVVCPVQPFGCIMLCDEEYWRDFFHILHPSFVFTTAIPPVVWNPLL